MLGLFETTWTCDKCGWPNFMSDKYCRHCGAPRPSRYGKMRVICRFKLLFFVVPVLLSFLLLSNLANAKPGAGSINRFNVVIVLDASNSMNYTDPHGLRYEAVGQFTDLLAERGNYLSGVVFSNHVEAKKDPAAVTSQADKDNVIEMLQSVMSDEIRETMGYTNVGEALQDSVEMLHSGGNSNLPSVIIFLSDGNTEMPTEDEQKASLEQKADAIQKAREWDINIYSVCLNANRKADTDEMKQISDATGGEFQEVANAEDLADVFNTFYSLIYGTSTISLVNEVFPKSGVVETEFDVPGIGVEEVNIIINGTVADITLLSPDGSDADMTRASSRSYTLVKMKNVVPGKWTLVTKGVPGSGIRVNMIYNTNLSVDVRTEPEELTVKSGGSIRIIAKLKAGDVMAISPEQYAGYEANLKILDAYQEEIDTITMDMGDGCFETDYVPSDGVYYMAVNVVGNYLEKTSEPIGPFTIAENIHADSTVINTAPQPIESPIKRKVYIWPFKGGNMKIDLGTLVKDAQDDELVYQIVSSSFIEGTDYILSENKLVMEHFSLSKGSFTVKVTDSGGLSCDVELIIATYNIGVITCIILAVGAVIALLAAGYSVWLLSRMRFRGTITVNRTQITPRRPGKCYLSHFHPEATGLRLNKCYFQATGENYVYLITDVPLKSSRLRETGKKTKIMAGLQVVLQADKEGSEAFTVKFESRIKPGRMGTGRPRRKALRPVRR